MEPISRQCVYTLLCGFTAVIAIVSAATSEDDKQVKMQLYQVSKGDWDNSGEKFENILKEEAGKYCTATPQKCDMVDLGSDEKVSFTTYEERSVETDKSYLIVTFALKLPKNKADLMKMAHQSDIYLKKEALQAITTNSRQKFRDETDWSIVDIDGEQQNLPPNDTMNIAISVTAVAILLILIVALLVMQKKCGKKTRRHEKLDGKETVA